MNKADFKKLIQIRRREVEALLKARHFHAAYYLAGYVIEYAFKVYGCGQMQRHTWPEKSYAKWYTHSAVDLANAFELRALMDSENDPIFQSHWNAVKIWSEESRYRSDVSEDEARSLWQAIVDERNGVLKWIQSHW